MPSLRQQFLGSLLVVAVPLNLGVVPWHARRQNPAGDDVTLPLDCPVQMNGVNGIVECLTHLQLIERRTREVEAEEPDAKRRLSDDLIFGCFEQFLASLQRNGALLQFS